MTIARDIMNTDTITVDPEDTVGQVMRLMIEHGISGLPVIDMSGQLVGVITEFDLLELASEPSVGKNQVYHYMTRDVHTIDETDELEAVAELFRILSIRRLLVVSGGRVVGVISRRDLMRHALASLSSG